MSELKVIDLGDIREAIVNNQSVYYEYYAKSEANKVIRHQKYKRCLAMAEWCDTEVGIADTDGDYEDMLWYQKWHQKWLELSEKFKEAKCR